MTINFGGVPLGSVLPVHFATYNSAGASVALSGLAVTDVEIYKGTTVTQRASDAGIALIDTDGIDIDGIVGAGGFSIDTGDDTDSGFYAAGSFYNVWVASVTIDGQVVNFLAATFHLTEDLTAAVIADAVWDDSIEGLVTARESMRLANSALGGKLSGAGTGTEAIRDLADTKDRLIYEVDDQGNRTAVTRDLT